jgi:hypothetical protein|tara:strand:- start:4895 stop:5026 length:132 start_codon:yes stop_codon:yes gene_type:complete
MSLHELTTFFFLASQAVFFAVALIVAYHVIASAILHLVHENPE